MANPNSNGWVFSVPAGAPGITVLLYLGMIFWMVRWWNVEVVQTVWWLWCNVRYTVTQIYTLYCSSSFYFSMFQSLRARETTGRAKWDEFDSCRSGTGMIWPRPGTKSLRVLPWQTMLWLCLALWIWSKNGMRSPKKSQLANNANTTVTIMASWCNHHADCEKLWNH